MAGGEQFKTSGAGGADSISKNSTPSAAALGVKPGGLLRESNCSEREPAWLSWRL